jgi:hypothetical protein
MGRKILKWGRRTVQLAFDPESPGVVTCDCALGTDLTCTAAVLINREAIPKHEPMMNPQQPGRRYVSVIAPIRHDPRIIWM